MKSNIEVKQSGEVIENDIVTEIKNEDKKLRGKYFLLLIACFIGGGICGLFMTGGAVSGAFTAAFAETVSDVLTGVSSYVVFALSVVGGLIVFIFYRQARKLYAAWDGEEEETLKRIEGKLSIAILTVSVETILFYLFSIIMLSGFFSSLKGDDNEEWLELVLKLVFYLAGFLFMMVSQILGQQKIINLEKEINPEKKGSIYDIKFQKKWLGSCDEAEQMMIYKAGYASYQAVNKLCVALMLCNLVGIALWDWGMVPAFMIAIIWMASMITYFVKAGRPTKGCC